MLHKLDNYCFIQTWFETEQHCSVSKLVRPNQPRSIMDIQLSYYSARGIVPAKYPFRRDGSDWYIGIEFSEHVPSIRQDRTWIYTYAHIANAEYRNGTRLCCLIGRVDWRSMIRKGGNNLEQRLLRIIWIFANGRFTQSFLKSYYLAAISNFNNIRGSYFFTLDIIKVHKVVHQEGIASLVS